MSLWLGNEVDDPEYEGGRELFVRNAFLMLGVV
jgi:hypothetical protein